MFMKLFHLTLSLITLVGALFMLLSWFMEDGGETRQKWMLIVMFCLVIEINLKLDRLEERTK